VVANRLHRSGATSRREVVSAELVWLVRNNVVENPWEQDVAIPAFEKENPDIKINLINLVQDDIAVKRSHDCLQASRCMSGRATGVAMALP
jgi:hypothetical protein